MKVSSTECALKSQVKTLEWPFVLCNTFVSGGFLVWHLHICPTQQENGGGEGGKEETRARYKPPHRTSWANNTVGGQTVLVVGGRDRVQAPVILFEYDVHSSRKASAGETVNTFSSRGCSQANRSSRKHSRLSDFFFFFFCYDSEVSLASSKTAANWFHLFTD